MWSVRRHHRPLLSAFFNLWTSHWRVQKSHDKVCGNAYFCILLLTLSRNNDMVRATASVCCWQNVAILTGSDFWGLWCEFSTIWSVLSSALSPIVKNNHHVFSGSCIRINAVLFASFHYQTAATNKSTITWLKEKNWHKLQTTILRRTN